ncbi:MAG: type III-A CRISPR-associated protein Csm2 [Chloroflexi bacterium]|nr:MAG: type III-A CRISPR-associated protein Csm2 [Chloroflexota bacterium]
MARGRQEEVVDKVIRKIQGLESGMKELEVESFVNKNGLADKVALGLGEDLKPTQLRKVFHSLKRIEREVKRDKENFRTSSVVSILPDLAYATGRGVIPKKFYELMRECIAKVEDASDFERFMKFLEAILAYHKFHFPKVS